ncbi:cation diffusion facilitator family transporter [candidate division CSSED10-310 bacterium]|uniref:Cation diffusion facilitator family transporter n=1 Tax=candidate division CSSED10-310 bacterium TaxID=2855610 RepID=A0ABV6YZA8_UNCC1
MKQSEKVGLYSVGINLLLVVIKIFLYLLSGSVVLIADAIHSSTDVISSLTVFAGIKISKRTSKSFPYGLYKVENFVSLLSSLFIFLAGYEIAHMAFFETHTPKIHYIPYAIGGILLTMVITFTFSQYELNQGRKINSPSLIADAQHIRTDMFSSGVVLAGLLGGMFGLGLDKIAAILVVLLIAKAGIIIFIDAIRVLLDASIDFETMDRVKTIIMGNPRVTSINGLWGRNSGPFKFIEANIVVKADKLDKAHFVSQRIEKEIRQQLSHVDHILIHYEPQKKETSTYAVPLGEDKKILAEHFGNAPWFYIATRCEKDGNLLSETYYHNPFAEEEKGKGIKVSEWLLEKGVDLLYSPKSFEGKGPAYVFSDADVEVIVADDKTLKDIQKDFQRR